MRLAVDIGGTFTDVVLQTPTRLHSTKVLTTYDDPANGVMTGIDEVLRSAGVQPGQVELVLHGTTLATNALIERRGAKTALLTTAGHRDVLEMAFENRFEQYDVNIERAVPLVPRVLRVGIEERVGADGSVLKPLDEDSVRAAVQILEAQEVTSVAIGLLHSYANASHEERVAEILSEACPNVSISLSSDVCPEIREYERLSTTTANAYVKPLMEGYLESLAGRLQAVGIRCELLLMTSGGGLTTLQAAQAYPVRLVESGPAGGAILAAQVASNHNLDSVLSFDMGGTTAKICLIDDGSPLHSRSFEVDRRYRFKKGSGLPVRIPVVEMVEIGAGGGSIASVDALRRVQVGPESAASEPGPACYGLGGTAATVTDADAVLGKLSPAHFAGGSLALELPAAETALLENVGAHLSLSAAEAATAVNEIVEENMASASRAHAAEWGKDLPSRAIIAFGGAAPLHAAGLARKLRINQVLIPEGAGVGSAVGFLLAPIRFEVVRSYVCRLDDLSAEIVNELISGMFEEASAVLAGAGVGLDTGLDRRVHAYMRYAGQGYEIAVPVTGAGDQPDLAVLPELFAEAYGALYGRTIPGMPIEVLSWTLALSAPGPQMSEPAAESVDSVAEGTPSDAQNVPVLERAELSIGQKHSGPLLVAESHTTTFVPESCSVEKLETGALLMRLGGET